MQHVRTRLAALGATVVAALALSTPVTATDSGPTPCSGVVVFTGSGYCPSAPRSHCMVLAGCEYLPEWAFCDENGEEPNVTFGLTCAWQS